MKVKCEKTQKSKAKKNPQSQMRNNANIKAKKRESQMRNANKGEKRESQMRNNANKSIIPYIMLYACTSNHDNQFHIVNCLNNLYDMIL